MKKILSIILAVLMCISSVAMIASCSNKNDTETPTTENTTPVQTEKPTEAPSEQPTEKPTEEVTTEEEPLPELTPAEEALAYIHQLYKDSLKDTGNYELVKKVKIGDITFDVVWTITGTDAVVITDKDETTHLVIVPKAEEDIKYTLTASITYEGETVSRSYEHVVPKFEVSGFADYIAAAAGDSVVVEGIITSISSKSAGSNYNNLYLQDTKGNGGYYIYEIADGKDPITDLGLKLGMTVSVSGIKEIYNGVHEVKKAVVEIVDATEKEIEFINITEIAKNAADAKDAALTNFQGCWVTIDGVEITGVNEAQYYYKWIIGNVDTYTRLALSSGLPSATLDEIKAGHTSHTGYTATVKGIVNVYNGAFYLIPLGADAFVYGAMAEVSDDVKVEREANALSVNATYTTTSKLTLPVVGATYNTVTIAWTSSNTEVATVAADGTVTFLKAGEVTFTATVALGEATETKTFTVTVETPKDPTPDSVLSIPQASAVGATKEHNTYTEGKYYVVGTIKDITPGVYGNMTIVDAEGNELYVYGTWNEDGSKKYGEMDNAPVVGDTVKLYGVIGKYNDKVQMKNGWIIPTTPDAPAQETIKITLGGNYVTATPYTYTSSSGSTKDQLKMSANADEAAVFAVVENADGSISFVCNGMYLYADGTNVRLVASEGEFTKFVYEDTEGGVLIRCFTANYNGNPQYLEVYKGNLTCYGINATSDITIYTFVIETVGTVAPSEETIKITLGGNYVTATPYTYTSSSGSTKDQLKMSANADEAAVFTVVHNADGSISFVTNGLYLYADGTNVRLVATEGEFTKFVYEETDGGVLIRCFTANYNGNPQYLEVYKGNLTCYGINATSDITIYTFVIETVGGGSTTPDEPVTPPTPPTPPTSEVTAVKPVVGTAYKLFMVQTKAGKTVFLDGGVSGYYLSTTEDFASALEFYIEETTGGFYVYTTINGAKKYLNMVVSGTHVNAVYGDTASTVYTYNETIKTIVGMVDGVEYVFGTRNDNTYTTVGANKLSYNPFMVQFTLASGSTTPEQPPVVEPDEPVEPEGEKVDVKYTFSEMEAGEQYAPENRVLDDNTTLITVDCHITTELRIYKAAAGGNAYSQWPARNGVAIIKSVKPLKNIVLNLGGKKTTFTISASVDGVTYVEVATIEVTSTDFSEFVVDLGDAGYKYVKLETAAQGRVKYFGLNFAEVRAEDFYVAEKPVEGTKYNFVMFQGAAEKFVLVNGLMNGYYMDTTADATAALNFYVEATEGGYYLYTMIDGYKIYLNMVVSGTHVNGKYEATPSTVYTYSETLKTLVTTINGTEYAFGTRNDKTYTTIGPVKTEQKPFIAQFALSTNDDVVANEPTGNVVITIGSANEVLAGLPQYGATTYNKYGVKGTVVSVNGTTITIKDAEGNTLVIKNALDATGLALTAMPGVGDTIVVVGALTNIGGKAMINGWVQPFTTHTCEMSVATCKTPSTCALCGKVEGTVTEEHTGWVDATCAEAAHCTVCGDVEGDKKAEHDGLVAGTCVDVAYCTVCGFEGEVDAENHTSVVAATCISAAFCADCDTAIGEKDPDAHGAKTIPTCIRPETCKLCGETFGEVSGEHGEIVDCACSICKETIHTGELSVPTCMVPPICSDCGEFAGEKDATNHVGFAPATCIAPATCECGAKQGSKDPDAHGELGAQCVCPLCKKSIHPAFDEECGCVDCGVIVHVFDKLQPTCTNGCGADNPNYLTVTEAYALGNSKSHNVYTTTKYTVKGIIVKIENTQYGNMYIRDEAGNEFYIYGLYSENGATRYDKLSVKPKVGDTVVLYGIIGKYSSTPQMKNSWMLAHEVHDTCTFSEATCAAPATCTVCGKTQGTATDDHDLDENCFCSVCEKIVHNYVDDVCTGCGAEKPAYETFTADFNTVKKNSAYSTYTTTGQKWVLKNGQVLTGGSADNSNSQTYKIIGDANQRAFVLNGKTSAKGSLTSATLSDGLSMITFNYANFYKESNGVDITINIKQNGTTVATKRLDNNSVTQNKLYTFTWDLAGEGVAVEGDFVIEIVNNSPSNSTSNKDRVAIWDLQWTTNP